VLIVADNGSYGTIRMHQEKHFPERVSATALHNPDFAALARTYGALGYAVNHSGEIDAALAAALAARRPAVVAVRTSLQHISAAATIGQLRARAAGARG